MRLQREEGRENLGTQKADLEVVIDLSSEQRNNPYEEMKTLTSKNPCLGLQKKQTKT
jgi:hypothetical protein